MRFTPALALLVALTACGDTSVLISDEPYDAVEYITYDEIDHPTPALNFSLDRDARTATFEAEDGTTTTLPFAGDPEWVMGCPTQFNAQQLEHIALQGDLEVDGQVFTDPAIEAECTWPGNPEPVDLGTADGEPYLVFVPTGQVAQYLGETEAAFSR